ncbi:hypothetical protein Tco_0688139, partial [Tanacetum coccineum]
MKEDVYDILVWAKFHDIPIIKFTEDGLSDIATKLDTSLMIESYTSAMCADSQGRSSYARAMAELRDDVELKYTFVVTVPKFIAILTIQEASTSNLFDALNMVENDNELGTNKGKSQLAEKGANSNVISSAHGTSSDAVNSPNTTHLGARINDLEREMLDGKLVLVNDDIHALKSSMEKE